MTIDTGTLERIACVRAGHEVEMMCGTLATSTRAAAITAEVERGVAGDKVVWSDR